MNEKIVPAAMKISKRIELATRLNLYTDKYSSENYQVMNYGIGGKITPHLDSRGVRYDQNLTDENTMQKSTEMLELGGPRIMTFMIYLTSVDIGGSTLFPQAGISVKPEMGSALFWFNMGPQNNYDSRIRHMGCPVLHGNKWIANKWIKWIANYRNYPCHIQKNHYSIIKK